MARLMSLLVTFFVLSSSMVPLMVSGAEWSVQDEGQFLDEGHEADDIGVVDGELTLALEERTYLQKDWTGSPGQDEWLDATSYHSVRDLDGTSPGELSLGKETWTRLADSPEVRTEHVAVWDPTRNNMVVMGGNIGGTTALDDTWSFDPTSNGWTAYSSSGVGRYWHTGTWDGHGNVIIFHGGMARSGATLKATNDTLALNTASDSWGVKANGTSKRYGHTAVWDPVRVRVLVFGGYANSALSGELWSYDPIGDTWERRTSAPVGLYEHSAVWAEGLDTMYVFGGLKEGGSTSKDLWAYDAVNDTWVQHGTGASSRSGQSAIWDPDNKKMIVVGGHSGTTKFNDTWTYDPSLDQWRRGKDLPGQPRTGHTLVWDTVNDRAILHGGKDVDGELGETWAFSPSYKKSGELVSSAFDISETSKLVNVSWDEGISTSGCSGTSLKLQLGASDTLDPGSFIFAGPSGTSSYYSNGETIEKGLAGNKYLRYKAYLSSTDSKCSPVLNRVRINYRMSLLDGNYTSPAFDTGSSNPHFLKVEYDYDNPGDSEVLVFFRASHLEDMSAPTDWEDVGPSDTGLATGGRRFVQFWVQMRTNSPGRVPTLSSFKLTYNSVPQLISFPVEPGEGSSGSEFVYKVMYKDGDGESPTIFKVYIDGDPHDMEPQEYDYKEGANFTFRTKLDRGAHKFRFKFADGTNTTTVPSEGEFEGPLVNDLPEAALKVPKSAAKGQNVKLDASGSKDPDGTLVQYKFDFGDGTDSGWTNSSSVKHVYKQKGKFNVKVHVKDDLGGTSVSATSEIRIEEKEASGFIPGLGADLTAMALVMAAILVSMFSARRRKCIYGKI